MTSPGRRAVLRALALMGSAAVLERRARGTESAPSDTTVRQKWDVIVVGAGVFGAWSAFKLREAGRKVLLVDAWGPAHSRASSGGESRLIRTEYAGDELYTRMAWESLPQWQALSQRAGLPIFHPVGALYLYGQDSDEVTRSLALHSRLGIPAARLDKAEIARRYPQIGLDKVAFAVLQPTMGALMARRAVQTLVAEFVAAGGTYQQLAVAPPRADSSLEALSTLGGVTLRAQQFVFACGPWLPKLFPDVVGARIVPTRQEVFFFAPAAGDVRFEGAHLPAWVDRDDPELHYGFPVLEARGFKIALDSHGPRFDPDTGERQITAQGLAGAREYLASRFPGIAHRPLAESRVCQYENTASGDFLLDRHPRWDTVWLAGGGSGHGFKHGPAVGQYISDLVTARRKTPEPRFALSRHQQKS